MHMGKAFFLYKPHFFLSCEVEAAMIRATHGRLFAQSSAQQQLRTGAVVTMLKGMVCFLFTRVLKI
jgi:hypothetical protein